MKLPWLQPAWQQFRDRLEQGRLAHALLLTGPAGSGKATLARNMVAMLLCLEPGERACGACRSCLLLKGGAHPERFVLVPEEGSRQIRIDAVRRFIGALTLTTSVSPRKVALIEPAEAMNISAANALLKSLEEPQGDTVIVLVSHDPSRLPVTIRSRCQAIAVNPPVPAEAADWLGREAGVDRSQADRALAASGGSPLLALQMLNSGEVEVFTALQAGLGALLSEPGAVSAQAAGLGEADPERLWRWLSLSAAAALRTRLGGAPQQWLEGAAVLDAARLSELQRAADRNRWLAAHSVRQDLLLQEWLLEWAGLAGSRAQAGGISP